MAQHPAHHPAHGIPHPHKKKRSIHVSPTTAVWVNIAFLLFTGVGAGAVDLAGLSPDAVSLVKTWCTNGAFIISCINMVLHLYSAPNAGPLAK